MNYNHIQLNCALSFNESVNVTVTHRVDIIPPESTYLTNSWGTPTIA